MIQLRHLTLGYNSRILLRDVDATFSAATFNALIGRNGTGKSTLLRAMAGLQPIIGGSILIDRHDIAQLPPQRRAQLVSLVTTQRVSVPNITVQQIVAMGRAPYTDWMGRLRQADRQKVQQCLELVHMLPYAHRMLSSLSDGEAQRVMIARALAQDTPLVLLDEPTSFLDIPNRIALCSMLAGIASDTGKCIIMSTHELSLAYQFCDNIALVANNTLHLGPAQDIKPLIDAEFFK